MLDVKRLLSFFCLCLLLATGLPGIALAQKQIDDLLIYHAYFGKASEVKDALDRGANPSAEDEHGWPVLAVVADRSDEEALKIARILIEYGANVDASKERNTPLANAIKNNNVELVYDLIVAGANVFAKGPDGMRPQQLAEKLGNQQIIDYISKKGFELQQALNYFRSQQHLQQVLYTYTFHHCAFQYWGFYLRSGQDRGVRDEEVIENRMRYHAREASKLARRGVQYFPDSYNRYFNRVAAQQKQEVFEYLNSMVSNRQRRRNGIGSIEDMRKRCNDRSASDHFRTLMEDRQFY